MSLIITPDCLHPHKALEAMEGSLENAQIVADLWHGRRISCSNKGSTVRYPFYSVAEALSNLGPPFANSLHHCPGDDATAWESRARALRILEKLEHLYDEGEKRIKHTFFTRILMYLRDLFIGCVYYQPKTLIDFAKKTFYSFTEEELKGVATEVMKKAKKCVHTWSIQNVTYYHLTPQIFQEQLLATRKEALTKKTEAEEALDPGDGSTTGSPEEDPVTQAVGSMVFSPLGGDEAKREDDLEGMVSLRRNPGLLLDSFAKNEQ